MEWVEDVSEDDNGREDLLVALDLPETVTSRKHLTHDTRDIHRDESSGDDGNSVRPGRELVKFNGESVDLLDFEGVGDLPESTGNERGDPVESLGSRRHEVLDTAHEERESTESDANGQQWNSWHDHVGAADHDARGKAQGDSQKETVREHSAYIMVSADNVDRVVEDTSDEEDEPPVVGKPVVVDVDNTIGSPGHHSEVKSEGSVNRGSPELLVTFSGVSKVASWLEVAANINIGHASDGADNGLDVGRGLSDHVVDWRFRHFE